MHMNIRKEREPGNEANANVYTSTSIKHSLQPFLLPFPPPSLPPSLQRFSDCTFADFIHAELESLFSPSRPESPPRHAPHSGTKSNIVSSNLRPVSSETQTSVQLPCQPPSPILGTRISQPPSGAKPVPKTQPLTPKYNAKNVAFQCIKDIPLELLTAVALCFKFHKVVCRQCFFSSGCRQLTTTKKSNTCTDGHQWRPLIIMPGCQLCSNFNHSTHIPVLPIPKHMKSVTSPFCICNKKGDHQQCYLMSKSTNPWFPHTVEELVIWTVERERCAYMYMYSVHLLHVYMHDAHFCCAYNNLHVHVYM